MIAVVQLAVAQPNRPNKPDGQIDEERTPRRRTNATINGRSGFRETHRAFPASIGTLISGGRWYARSHPRARPPTRAGIQEEAPTLLAAAVMVILSASDVNLILATPRQAAHAHDSRIRDHAQAGSRHDPMSTQPRNVQDRTP
ncbi:hypothetical protein OsJ_34614 [Oryza sativa Japonica Group]|uniref:Uncharacterized protein n=1 Tax=Oryza sativa subsp. japonica TaxID=39947 RepID=B9G8I9_ORYSJ|nr:hypothetical protein OsJ_34614 [Oryza sativa Japonica Group]